MPSATNVLLFGNDDHLLDTRRLVLESAGCTVYTVSRLLALNQILTDHPIDLLILCHTLSEEECDRVKSMVQVRWSKVKVMVLAANTFAQCSESGDRVFNSADGPKALLDRVEQMARIPAQSVKRQSVRGTRATQ